jgi:hypothetical protein
MTFLDVGQSHGPSHGPSRVAERATVIGRFPYGMDKRFGDPTWPASGATPDLI